MVPAATAAVSARSTVGPRPTPCRKPASSSSSHPPSGPTATTGWASDGRAAHRGGPAAEGRPTRAARSEQRVDRPPPRAATSAGTGRPPPGPPVAAAPPPARPRSPSQRTTERAVWIGHDPVHPELGELLDDPLGPVALGRGEGHRDRRVRPSGSSDHRPVGHQDAGRSTAWRPPGRRRITRHGDPRARHRRPATTSSPGRRRSTSSRWWASACVEHGSGRVVDEDHGRRGHQHRDPGPCGADPAPDRAPRARPRRHGQLSAERSFEKIPSLCGSSPSSSPRASARRPEQLPLVRRRGSVGRVHLHVHEEVAPTPAAELGHARAPSAWITAPVWVPAAMVRSRRSSRVSKATLPPRAAMVTGRAPARAGRRRSARRRGRARPKGARTGPRWARPGSPAGP